MRNDIGKYLSFECEVEEYTPYIIDTFDTQWRTWNRGEEQPQKRMCIRTSSSIRVDEWDWIFFTLFFHLNDKTSRSNNSSGGTSIILMVGSLADYVTQ